MIRKWLWLLVDTEIHMLVGGAVLKMKEGAANIPTWTGLNGQASRQEYRQEESSSSDSSNCVPILHK